MACAKKHNFVIRKLTKARRKEIQTGDLFYFDQASWERLLGMAERSGEGFTRKGDKRPREHVARKMESQRRNAAKRQAEKLAVIGAAQAAKRRARHVRHFGKPGPRRPDMVLSEMVAGEFYGAMDLARLIGDPDSARRSFHAVLLKLEQRGLVRRAPNPEWRGPVRNLEPEHIWTLTDAGQREQGAARDRVNAALAALA